MFESVSHGGAMGAVWHTTVRVRNFAGDRGGRVSIDTKAHGRTLPFVWSNQFKHQLGLALAQVRWPEAIEGERKIW